MSFNNYLKGGILWKQELEKILPISTILDIDPEPNWYQVTPNCFTKLGASLELKKWIRENVPKEFDI